MQFVYDVTYPSVSALAEVAETHHAARRIGRRLQWAGVADEREVYDLAARGWTQDLDETVRLAEEAIATVERENDVPAWIPVYDVTGSTVDIGLYLSGEPACMVEVPPVRIAKVGRIVTLCYSTSISGSVDPARIVTRGRTIVALALALERLGYGLEIVSDLTASRGSTKARIRVTVKGVRDEVDPARLMFALAHPAYLRQLTLAAMHAIPAQYHATFGIGSGYGTPTNPAQDLADGTLYLPAHCTSTDKDIAADLAEHLRALDILA